MSNKKIWTGEQFLFLRVLARDGAEQTSKMVDLASCDHLPSNDIAVSLALQWDGFWHQISGDSTIYLMLSRTYLTRINGKTEYQDTVQIAPEWTHEELRQLYNEHLEWLAMNV